MISDETKIRLFIDDGSDRVYRQPGERHVGCCIKEIDMFGGSGLMVRGGISTI